MTTAPTLPEGLEPVAWTEKQTMTAIKTAKTWGTVKLTREVGPYDIDVPTFDASLLALAIVAARDVQWDAALQALAAEKDAEIAALKLQIETGPLYSTRLKAKRYEFLRDSGGGDFVVVNGMLLEGERLDAAIDSALALAAKEAK